MAFVAIFKLAKQIKDNRDAEQEARRQEGIQESTVKPLVQEGTGGEGDLLGKILGGISLSSGGAGAAGGAVLAPGPDGNPPRPSATRSTSLLSFSTVRLEIRSMLIVCPPILLSPNSIRHFSPCKASA